MLSKIKFLDFYQSTPANLMKLTPRSLFLSLAVDTQLITSLYGSKLKDVHFNWPNTEMICILRQLKSTGTELGQAHNGICLSDG